MMKKTVLIAIGVLTAISHNGFCQQPTRLQVFSTSDKEKANSMVKRVEALGLGPAKVHVAGSQYKVLTRSFDSAAEANFAKPSLVNAGFSGSFAVADAEAVKAQPGNALSVVKSDAFEQLKQELKLESNKREYPKITPAQEVSDNNRLSEEELFAKAMGYWKNSHIQPALKSFQTFLERFPASAHVPRAKLMVAYWHLTAGNQEMAKRSLEAICKEYAGKNEAGEATLRLAYFALKNKQDAEALALFKSLAEGQVPASESHRSEALLRLAALYHRGKDLKTAESAYAAISQVSSDPEVKAYAQVQITGLIMEQAWNGKRTFGEARTKADSILRDYPSVAQSTRATAALMGLETLCYEKKFEEALKRQGSLTEFSGTGEEPLMKYWIAKANLETGKVQEGLAMLDSITQSDPKTEKRFKNLNLVSEIELLKASSADKIQRSLNEGNRK